MKNSRRDQDQVYAQWISRTEDAREASHAEAFADELWDTGLRLSRQPHMHYQLVMGIIRGAILHTYKQKDRHVGGLFVTGQWLVALSSCRYFVSRLIIGKLCLECKQLLNSAHWLLISGDA